MFVYLLQERVLKSDLIMTHLLSDEEVSEFREIFNLVDRDGGGTITKEELGELMDTLGIDASPEEVDLMIREVCQ